MKTALILMTMVLLTSCAAIRGVGLSEQGVDAIRDVLVSEVVTELTEEYCDRPQEKRETIRKSLKDSGIDIFDVEC